MKLSDHEESASRRDSFDAATIASLYPDHRSYVAAVDRAARRAVARGVLIGVDATAIRRAARSSSIGQ